MGAKASFVAQLVKNLLQYGRPGFNPWVGKIPWRSESLPTPVLWPGELHGLCSPWGHKESVMNEQISLSLSKVYLLLINICTLLAVRLPAARLKKINQDDGEGSLQNKSFWRDSIPLLLSKSINYLCKILNVLIKTLRLDQQMHGTQNTTPTSSCCSRYCFPITELFPMCLHTAFKRLSTRHRRYMLATNHTWQEWQKLFGIHALWDWLYYPRCHFQH